MFVTRLISGIILLAIVIATGLIGGPIFFALVAVLSLIGLFEIYRMLQLQNSVFYLLSMILWGADMVCLFLENFEAADAICLFSILIFLAVFVFRYPKFDISQVFSAYAGFMYSVMLFSFLFRIRCMEDGMLLLWLVFIGSWGSDTCAYVAGRLFGKHKAFPVLSPKKTIEGCLGGAVGTSICFFIYAILVKVIFSDITLNVFLFAVIGILASVVSQIGDLAASAMKRKCNIKDYGKLIPGHGGVIDRFDSLLFTAPLIYYAVTFFAS